jgi:hypothetical protein
MQVSSSCFTGLTSFDTILATKGEVTQAAAPTPAQLRRLLVGAGPPAP